MNNMEHFLNPLDLRIQLRFRISINRLDSQVEKQVVLAKQWFVFKALYLGHI